MRDTQVMALAAAHDLIKPGHLADVELHQSWKDFSHDVAKYKSGSYTKQPLPFYSMLLALVSIIVVLCINVIQLANKNEALQQTVAMQNQVIATMQPPDANKLCPVWLFGSNMAVAKKRICKA